MQEIKTDSAIQDSGVFPTNITELSKVQSQTVTLPNEPIEVIIPGKDSFDYTLGIVTIAGVVITVIYTFYSIRKLLQKDEDKQNQINKLSDIAKKMEFQNEILKESNSLVSQQVDVLRSLTLKTKDSNATSELVKIEREKLELEHKPRLSSNNFGTAMTQGSFVIDNNGKALTIKRLESMDQNILIDKVEDFNNKSIAENGRFIIHTRTRDNSAIHEKNYMIKIFCTNEIEKNYIIELKSDDMSSLQHAVLAYPMNDEG